MASLVWAEWKPPPHGAGLHAEEDLRGCCAVAVACADALALGVLLRALALEEPCCGRPVPGARPPYARLGLFSGSRKRAAQLGLGLAGPAAEGGLGHAERACDAGAHEAGLAQAGRRLDRLLCGLPPDRVTPLPPAGLALAASPRSSRRRPPSAPPGDRLFRRARRSPFGQVQNAAFSSPGKGCNTAPRRTQRRPRWLRTESTGTAATWR